jgi:hypothetical protein
VVKPVQVIMDGHTSDDTARSAVDGLAARRGL